MTIEAGVLVGIDGTPLFWHLPEGRNVVHLPDSRNLWDVMLENRDKISGFAHSHPGSGWPRPSKEDITTFSAVELGLGRRLFWWIASADRHVAITWTGPDKYAYDVLKMPSTPPPTWMAELRNHSRF